MRYYIMFGITLIILLIILFYNPFLGVYKNTITIEYPFVEEGYTWNYDISSKALSLKKEEENKWIFKTNKNGYCELDFNYSNEEDIKYHIYYKFFVLGKNIYWLEGYGEGLVDYPNPV